MTAPGLAVVNSDTITPFSSTTPPGRSVPLFSSLPGEVFALVTDSNNASARDIRVSWVGSDGARPVGYEVYYKFVFPQCQTSANGGTSCVGQPQQPLNQTNAKLLGTMSSYMQVFQAPKSEANFTATTGVLIGLVNPNGTSVAAITPGDSQQSNPNAIVSVSSLYPSNKLTGGQGVQATQATQIMTRFFSSIFGLFIPLLAIVGTYSTYGKDRVSGVLESVLAQPVTRRGLSLSRYLSTFAAMSAAVVVSVAVVDLVAQHFAGSFVSSAIVVSSTGALLVELAAFIGIAMLLSHLVKSSGTLIGLSIGLFLLIDFFQGLIVTIVAAILQIGPGSVGYYQVSVALDFLNPAQFVSLVVTYFTNVFTFVGIISTQGLPITPQSYGITIPAIVLTGLLWVAVPLACFLYLATKKD
ncbi:MAG: ABC transporter permease [Thaumarchaeota archaeon]|nr:ABC transporter permease [Nitrososphaerota archaeon]